VLLYNFISLCINIHCVVYTIAYIALHNPVHCIAQLLTLHRTSVPPRVPWSWRPSLEDRTGLNVKKEKASKASGKGKMRLSPKQNGRYMNSFHVNILCLTTLYDQEFMRPPLARANQEKRNYGWVLCLLRQSPFSTKSRGGYVTWLPMYKYPLILI